MVPINSHGKRWKTHMNLGGNDASVQANQLMVIISIGIQRIYGPLNVDDCRDSRVRATVEDLTVLEAGESKDTTMHAGADVLRELLLQIQSEMGRSTLALHEESLERDDIRGEKEKAQRSGDEDGGVVIPTCPGL
ncbi:hypothetical protein C8R44DRAFT_740561 [Mycena epipterygia]|nr:hypothetical protein C8R44DRAFT_740561 [Mycena epipterygia]